MSSSHVSRIRELPSKAKFALGGMLAMLLGRRAADWSDAFCKKLLRRVVVGMLKLGEEQYEAVAPLSNALDAMEWRPESTSRSSSTIVEKKVSCGGGGSRGRVGRWSSGRSR